MREESMSAQLREKIHQDAYAHWGGVYAMTLCVFVLIASEFMPVSLLTPLAENLGVSEGWVGQGISISGALAVCTSLLVCLFARHFNRRHMLLGLTALMGVSALLIAIAPSYLFYMIGRALIGIAIGGFWSLSAATAMYLVPKDKVPRALAVFNGGNALATVVAAPLGSYLGSVIGWRGAFFCIVPCALIALLWQKFSLPNMPADTTPAKAENVFLPLGRPEVAVGLAACGLFFMGQFCLFTYVRPFLETGTRADIMTISSILLIIGLSGLIGTFIIVFFLNANFYLTLSFIPVLMALIAVALTIFGHNIWASGGLLALWGLTATAAPAGWWTWIARTLPKNAEAGGGLMVAVIQLSIAAGSTLGGLIFDHIGYRGTFVTSSILLLTAAGLTLLTSRITPSYAGQE